YIGCAISYDEPNVERIHKQTYEEAARAGLFLTSGSPYWEDMARNAEHFYQQLPNYHVKPLYVWLIYLFHKLGFPYVKASVVPSVVSSVLIFGVIFLWLAKFADGLLWGLSSIFVGTLSGLDRSSPSFNSRRIVWVTSCPCAISVDRTKSSSSCLSGSI